MIYTSFSLNGSWEMSYCEEKYSSDILPSEYISCENYNESCAIENAVPGYWEDMQEKFIHEPFFDKLKINPEYELQSYPMSGTAPDMALPNIVGNFFYKKTFEFKNIKGDISLHFEGVQNSVRVWINGVFIGSHEGYSAPFEFSLSEGMLNTGENIIVLSVSNHPLSGYENQLVSGLTNRAANQYTGGITGAVELRVYNTPLRDVAIFVSEDCSLVNVKCETTEKTSLNWLVCDDDDVIKSGETEGDFLFSSDNLENWSPESPKLYTLKITCSDCTLERKFGIRKLLADGVHFKLNNTPYYLRGICEHCYFPQTIHPDHDYKYYCSIIKEFKKLGFNFIRFHTYIPEEEYMQAADELGMLLHVECPNNTTIEEWKQIVRFCRNHTSVVIYCCGNELLMDDPFIDHLEKCGEVVHRDTDALFSPMSAMRGVEYMWMEPDQMDEINPVPFKHHPRRLARLGKFCDMYSSYANGRHSYISLDLDNIPAQIDKWSCVYNKPRVSHEICIDGTYADLSLKDRYKGTRVGETDMFSSIERHLESKGLLKNAPLYFKNSSEWQRRVRKYCFENVRMSNNIAGYDFLGPIDTHWHTFGYDVGMMNEFYELKPGETNRNVLMYNSPTILLNDLEKKTNFVSGSDLEFSIYTSHYGKSDLKDAELCIKLFADDKLVESKTSTFSEIANGQVSKLESFSITLPDTIKPLEMKLYATLNGDEVFAENEWELYLFPKPHEVKRNGIIIKEETDIDELCHLLEKGKDVLLFGGTTFETLPTTFRISLAGRTSGNLATVVCNHTVLENMPHDGFCGWQFSNLFEGGRAVCFETDEVPFDPIIEVVSSHKYAIKQAALFEFKVEKGRLLVCSFNFGDEPCANWFKNELVSYVQSNKFNPVNEISLNALKALANVKIKKAEENTNFAFNKNDKTAVRKK